MKSQEKKQLVQQLNSRFASNRQRHPSLQWDVVLARLEHHPAALQVLLAMETTGGEPDVVGVDQATGQIVFCDCSPESPIGRRSLCFDGDALAARKENKPQGSVIEMVTEMGAELLTEEQYRELQRLGEFDKKTSSWVATPADVRVLGGALFCDRRYGRVFVYHNGAQSYYAARGFRSRLCV